ncbi:MULTISPECIES: hypothetical protein [unclassified Streptomyces]|uniref:LppU/SCO3897 family protein n=1 Tax=unclassified Streptomyces TaxID=2593676 RepID=UPI001BEC14B0|nr:MULTISPECIES: hypothetical protein [unclassified Streptomyces]MBT2407490.1 hypothetical protein [Streptomyces sp. ISL-21]MBT2609119.1 hypothetical protein [Streptomyces sp. ISL-87]
MSSQEIPVTLTPQQARYGVILTVPLATGTARLRIPPSRDGDLVRARLGDDEVLLRVRVAPAAGATGPAPVPGQPGSAGASGARGCLVALGVVGAVIASLVWLNSGDDDSADTATATPTTSYSSWSPAPAPAPDPVDTATDSPSDTATDPVAPPSEAAPSPFDRGTCLNGTLPDSTTPKSVSGVDEVSCSASDAHYRVIERFPFTSDLNECNDNPKTEYAFSYRYTRNGIAINEYVYCLVGIGSYAR